MLKWKSIVSPEDQRVTFVELFFDLVFVFSITQVVSILHHGVDWVTAGEALLIFWIVWWAWTQFTWALNAADTDHPAVQLSVLVATAVAFFMAVAVPSVFEGGALWFAIPYVIVRTIGLVVYAWAASSEKSHLTAVRTFSLVSIGGLAAVVAGAILGGEALFWFWGFAILLDVIAAGVGGAQEGWNLHSGHFVERHGLIVIIALGESLIVAAAGLSGSPEKASLAAVGLMSVALTCALWWSYFPRLLPSLERAMHHRGDATRAAFARDTFSLLHFPMLFGVIGIAAAIEAAISHPDHALPLGVRAALGGGVLLFVGGSALVSWRASGDLSATRTGLAIVAAVGIVALGSIPPWASMAIGVAFVVAILVVEERRARLSIVGREAGGRSQHATE